VLRRAAIKIVVVTTSPILATGLFDPAIVEAMHQRLHKKLAPDAIETLPAPKDENCLCRKPSRA